MCFKLEKQSKRLMKKIISISTIAMFAMVLGMGSVLPALPQAHADVPSCMNDIDLVRDILNNDDGDDEAIDIAGRHSGQTLYSLNSKLDGADDKLQDGKFNKAYQKLDQFEDKVNSLNIENAKFNTPA